MSPDADDRGSSARFVRGLTLGALLGAIIAGSSVWTRTKVRRRVGRTDDADGRTHSLSPPATDPVTSERPRRPRSGEPKPANEPQAGVGQRSADR